MSGATARADSRANPPDVSSKTARSFRRPQRPHAPPSRVGLAAERRELLGLEFLRQRADQLIEIALHDRVDLVERQVDPVIGHASLRKVVRADPLAAIPGTDQALPVRCLLLLAFPALLVDEPRRKDRHRLRAIAVLRAVVLAFDDDAG